MMPRKFMIFNIRPFNEAILEDVQIDFYHYHQDEQSGHFAEIGMTDSLQSLDSGNLGLVTRGFVKNLDIRFHDQEDLTHWLQAEKVLIDFKKRELRMSDVRICDHLENREIIARKAAWREGEKHIHIPGSFIVETPRGRQKGKGGVFSVQQH